MLALELSLEAAAVLGGAAPIIDPLTTTPTAWYDPSDLSTLFQDSAGLTPVTAHGDPVGLMQDKSGNGLHLAQASDDTRRPLYQDGGFLLFDGVNDVLLRTTTLTLPFDRITSMRQVAWVVNRAIWHAGSNAGQLTQNASSPQLRLLSGGTANALQNGDLAVGANGVVTERHIANASLLAVNNGAYVGPNDVGAISPTTINLGATATGASAANFRFYGALIKDSGGFTTEEIADLRTYLGSLW